MAGRILQQSLVFLLALISASPALANTSTVVPFTEKDGLVFIRVKVNGVRVIALVDSGATVTNVDADLVSSKGCAYRTVLTSSGDKVTGCEQKAEVRFDEILLASKVTAYHFPAAFGSVKVILSLRDLARGGRVTFDYENQVLVLSPKD